MARRRQSLLLRQQAIYIIERLADVSEHKIRREDLYEELYAAGLMPDADDALRAFKAQSVHKLVRQINAAGFEKPTPKEVQLDLKLKLVNVVDVLPSGKKEHFYKDFGDTTLVEGCYVANERNKAELHYRGEKLLFAADLVVRFGREAVQARLEFDLPPDVGLMTA